MARAMGRSVKTEQMYTIARMRRANEAGGLTPSGELPEYRPRLLSRLNASRAGAVVIEAALMLLLALGAFAAVHSVRPEPSCASCLVEG